MAPAVATGRAASLPALRQKRRPLSFLPLLERKRHLVAIMRAVETRLLYVDHVAERGDLFRVTCERDLEGIVATLTCLLEDLAVRIILRAFAGPSAASPSMFSGKGFERLVPRCYAGPHDDHARRSSPEG